MASDFVTVAKSGDIGDGDLASFDVNGVKVTVANVGGTFYAFDDTCTHRQCSLVEGELEERVVVCPCHGSKFDVTTGAVVNPPAELPVKTYALQIQDGAIAVQV